MVRSVLLAPLDCRDLRDHLELLDPEEGLETRGRTALLAHRGHRDPQARMAAMAPLARLDLPD